MKIKDLASKKFQRECFEPGILLLTWKEPYKTWYELYMVAKDNRYKSLKDQGHEYFKALAMCINYTTCEVSLRNQIGIYPKLKRGTRGFILEDRAIELFNTEVQEMFKENVKDHGTKLVLFDGFVFGIPLEMLNIKKK